ncbi:hypothetical protein [Desulfomicrobium salsuginis]
MTRSDEDCVGFCRDCGREHALPAAPAMPHALALMGEIEERGGIAPPGIDDPRLGLDYLFGPARGQMFGVLVCRDGRGNEVVLKAFSGQYNGVWEVPGWVQPVVDPEEFGRTIRDDEPRIKALTRRIEALPPDSPLRRDLLAERRALSAGLMERIFELYRPANFRGQRRPLRDVFLGRAMPTGTGECCAPKLLHHAALHGLVPRALAEFYVGRENRSGTRSHGRFFAPCAEKCRPILGFMLCGVEELRSGAPMP